LCWYYPQLSLCCSTRHLVRRTLKNIKRNLFENWVRFDHFLEVPNKIILLELWSINHIRCNKIFRITSKPLVNYFSCVFWIKCSSNFNQYLKCVEIANCLLDVTFSLTLSPSPLNFLILCMTKSVITNRDVNIFFWKNVPNLSKKTTDTCCYCWYIFIYKHKVVPTIIYK
jgi:hypothetical protein